MSGGVEDVLDAAVTEGFMTPSAAADGVVHSTGFLRPVDGCPPIHLESGQLGVDLGTGGGLPGLILAGLTGGRWVLVDRGGRRCEFLTWAVRELGMATRVEVLCADVVDVARGPLRGQASLVTARSFASPSITAECGAPLLAQGGRLVVSEPPEAESRWPAEALGLLGLTDEGGWHTGTAGYRALVRNGECPDRYPRRSRRRAASPLF